MFALRCDEFSTRRNMCADYFMSVCLRKSAGERERSCPLCLRVTFPSLWPYLLSKSNNISITTTVASAFITYSDVDDDVRCGNVSAMATLILISLLKSELDETWDGQTPSFSS